MAGGERRVGRNARLVSLQVSSKKSLSLKEFTEEPDAVSLVRLGAHPRLRQSPGQCRSNLVMGQKQL